MEKVDLTGPLGRRGAISEAVRSKVGVRYNSHSNK